MDKETIRNVISNIDSLLDCRGESHREEIVRYGRACAGMMLCMAEDSFGSEESLSVASEEDSIAAAMAVLVVVRSVLASKLMPVLRLVKS